jgi:ribonuclease HI
MKQYKIILDGGSKGNTKAKGNAYGSYFFMNMVTQEHKIVRLKYPELNTSNEAEWETLISVLQMLKESPKARVRLFMDSKLVVNQFNGSWKCKDDRMLTCRTRAHKILRSLKKSGIDLSLEWLPRDDIEMFLGH